MVLYATRKLSAHSMTGAYRLLVECRSSQGEMYRDLSGDDLVLDR